VEGSGKRANQRQRIWTKDPDQKGAFKQVAEGGSSVESEEKNRPFSELPEGVSILVESLFPFPQVANERLSWPTQEEAILPVNVVGLELNPYRFLNVFDPCVSTSWLEYWCSLGYDGSG
jgi:hypothetical protein